MKKLLLTLLFLTVAAPAMAFQYGPGDTLRFCGSYHNDTGSSEDPTSPTAVLQIKARTATTITETALTAPAKDGTNTGHFCSYYTVIGSPVVGDYSVLMTGAVTTGKAIAKDTPTFHVNTVSDFDGGAGAGLAGTCPTSNYFTISGTPTTTVFNTNLTQPTGSWDPSSLSAYILIEYADGKQVGGELSSYSNTNGQITLGSALSVAPASGDTGCVIDR